MLSPDFIYGMPLYPYFLAALYKVFGENVFAIRLIQMLLGVLSCLLIYFISKQIFNQRVALISMFLCAFYGMFIFYEGMLLGTGLTILFSCLIILVLLSIQRNTSYKKWILLGLLVGLCSLNRASVLLFIPMALVWFSLSNKDRFKKKFISQLVFCATLVVVIAPITIRNYLIAEDFIPITAHSGINFYIGNNPYADGSLNPPQSMHISVQGLLSDSIIQAQRLNGRQLKPSEVSQYWFAQSADFIRTQPLSYFKLLLKKFAFLFNTYEIFDVVDYSFFRQRFPTILNLPLANLRLVLPLGLLGIVLSLKLWKRCLLLYLFMASFVISIVAYFVNARYRLPLIIFLIIFSAYTLDWWLVLLRSKKIKPVFLSLCALVLFYLVTNLKLTQQNFVSQYNNLGVAYKEMGKFDLAITAYEEALKINPNLAQARSNLGNLYNATGEYAKAIQQLQKSIELDPDLAEAHSNLAIVYTKTGKIDKACAEYKKALQIRPNLVIAHYNLAVIYQKREELDLATKEFKQTIKFAPDHANAYNNLGVIYFEQGLFKEAQAHWQRALKINPGLGQAKENLKRLEN